jgi:hypothetical protein
MRSCGAKRTEVNDDLEATLNALEDRLRGLQAEFGRTSGPATAPVTGSGPLPEGSDPSASASHDVRSAVDPLDQFGVELRRLASELVDAWDRVAAHERAAARTRHRLVLETQADVHALAALERALASAPGVRDLELRAYAGGHASLVVDLS